MGFHNRRRPDPAAAGIEPSNERFGGELDDEHSGESLLEQARWHVGRTIETLVTITAYPCQACGEGLTDPAERYALVRIERSYIAGAFTSSECLRCGATTTDFPRREAGA